MMPKWHSKATWQCKWPNLVAIFGTLVVMSPDDQILIQVPTNQKNIFAWNAYVFQGNMAIQVTQPGGYLWNFGSDVTWWPNFDPICNKSENAYWHQLAPVGTSWHQLAPAGTSWHQLAPAGTSWHQLVCGNVAWFGMVGRKSQHQLASTSWPAPVGTSWH